MNRNKPDRAIHFASVGQHPLRYAPRVADADGSVGTLFADGSLLGHAMVVSDQGTSLSIQDCWRTGPRFLQLQALDGSRPTCVLPLEAALAFAVNERRCALTEPDESIDAHLGQFVARTPSTVPTRVRLAVALESGLGASLQRQVGRVLGMPEHGVPAVADALLAHLVAATVRLAVVTSATDVDVQFAGSLALPEAVLRERGRYPSMRWLLGRIEQLLAESSAMRLRQDLRALGAHAVLIVADWGVRARSPEGTHETTSTRIGAATVHGITPAVAAKRVDLEPLPGGQVAEILLSPVAAVDLNGALLAYAGAHEFGHVLGAGHDRENFDPGPRPLEGWARAALVGDSATPLQTVMGTQAVRGPNHVLARRLPCFSSTGDLGFGFAAGSRTENNAALIAEVAAASTRYRF